MFDILPAHQSTGQQKKTKRSVAHILSLTWKLPARLRRPIRQQLYRQRKQAQARRAIVRFEKRQIFSDVPSRLPHHRGSGVVAAQAPSSQATVSGAEQHTGDVYLHSRPSTKLSLPPYRGRITRESIPQHSGVARDIATVHDDAPGHRVQATQQPVRRALPDITPSRPRQKFRAVSSDSTSLLFGERDVPFEWPKDRTAYFTSPRVRKVKRDLPPARSALTQEAATQPSVGSGVTLPRRRLLMPISIGVIPKGFIWNAPSRLVRALYRSASAVRNTRQQKRPLLNLVLFLVGCGLIVGVVGQLQNLGAVFRISQSVVDRAEAAYQHLVAAQSALAQTDFSRSEQAFLDAESLLKEARGEFEGALASSHLISRYLDVTGTVHSGHELLAAGEALTRAGQHISRGLAPLLTADVPVSEQDLHDGPTVVDVLELSERELSSALLLLEEAHGALVEVDSPLLPQDIADQVEHMEAAIPRVSGALRIFLDHSEALLAFLGAERERQYLLLLENNHELRPTGGFIGSFALVDIDRGVVESVAVRSVYDPDGQLKEFIAPPDPLLLVTPRWYMRDANWFVDYSVSARKIAEFFEKEGGPTVDGVIALTPEVVRDLLRITGPIEIPHYGVTVTDDNFTSVTQDHVTYSYDRELNQPKQFLADLTPLLLNRLFAVPAQDTLSVVRVLEKVARQKHLLFYFRDENLQRLIEGAGWGGVLPKDQQGMLVVNTANIAGHKTDQFMEQEIDGRFAVTANGDVDVAVMIRRTHRGPEEVPDYEFPPDENPAYKDNIVYQRVLVPSGARLLEARGFATAADLPRPALGGEEVQLVADPDVAEWQRSQLRHSSGTLIGKEAGYTFFANWLVTRPGETSVAFYHYRVPAHAILPTLFDPAASFQVYVSKQPGDMRTNVRVEISVPEDVRILHTVPLDGVTPAAENKVVYRGALSQDLLVGLVLGRK